MIKTEMIPADLMKWKPCQRLPAIHAGARLRLALCYVVLVQRENRRASLHSAPPSCLPSCPANYLQLPTQYKISKSWAKAHGQNQSLFTLRWLVALRTASLSLVGFAGSLHSHSKTFCSYLGTFSPMAGGALRSF